MVLRCILMLYYDDHVLLNFSRLFAILMFSAFYPCDNPPSITAFPNAGTTCNIPQCKNMKVSLLNHCFMQSRRNFRQKQHYNFHCMSVKSVVLSWLNLQFTFCMRSYVKHMITFDSPLYLNFSCVIHSRFNITIHNPLF